MSNLPVLQSHAARINLVVGQLREAVRLPATHEICIYCADRYPIATQVHDHCPSWECRRLCGECARERAEDWYKDMAKRREVILWDDSEVRKEGLR